ncbi:helix-turn-helix transcriptional regulator [Algoriphagus formosus]|uniref:helix-turn-helix transcriptional regulator n=1 Tax=Algoriphagus formosus TaxID=2007308 RepID=UPI000C292B80|nr:WYL domain-containing protein [Algoriphagus formosus]
MPKNKNVDIRYRVLDECLRDRVNQYTLEDLAKKCAKKVNELLEPEEEYTVTTRQIRMDLRHLESEAGFGASIISQKIPGSTKHFHRYEDPDFSISNKPLKEEDIANLKSTLFLLQRFGGTHHEEWIHDFALRIEDLPVKKNKISKDSGSSPSEKKIIVQYDHQDSEGGGEFIVRLYQAIENRQSLSVIYQEFGHNQASEYLVSPYLLKQYNRRWFLLCASEGLDHLTTLPLDRIKEIKNSKHPYRTYGGPGDEPINFFDEILGVINDPQLSVMTIELEVHKKLLPYLKAKLLHESQKMEKATDDPDWFSIKINVKPNYELYSVLLSHGPKLRVISPVDVRNKMKELVEEMEDHYK